MGYYGDTAFPPCGESVASNKAGMVIDQEAAGHMTSAIRKQREMNARGQIPFPFYSFWTLAHGVVELTFRVSLPPQLI